MISIPESGVGFGEFAETSVYRLEHSPLHKYVGDGIKSVEFILLRKEDNILFVEAKTSCPNENNKDSSDEKREKYIEFFDDVEDKFTDSFHMFLMSVLGRYDDRTIGSEIKNKQQYKDSRFIFVLVITAAELDWLQGPKIELEKRLIKLRKIWDIKIVVLNTELGKNNPWNFIKV